MQSWKPLLIEERAEANTVRLIVTGELDLATRSLLRRRLFRARHRGEVVHLDLSKLEFVDAAGAGMLIRALADSRQAGWHLQIASQLAPQVARVFDLTGLDLE